MRIQLQGWRKAFLSLVVVWVVLLHLCCFFSAGALWRDEANSVQQARLPTWTMVRDSLRFDSFPALYPALLRLWTSSRWGGGDLGLRWFGLLTGLCILLSVWCAGRLICGRAPLVCLALLAADPVFISDGDSIRPYGISLLCIIWAFVCFTKWLVRPSAASLAGAALASVFAVQVSYVNALLIGVLSLGAAAVAVWQGRRQTVLLLFTPGCMAGLSLLPYAGVLRQAGDWAPLLHSRIEWLPFLRSYIKTHSLVYPVAWAGFLLLALGCLAGGGRKESETGPGRRAIMAYSTMVALASAAVQVLFVAATGVPPFPRYFLPAALFLALALEAMLAHRHFKLLSFVVLASLVLTAVPSWRWLRQRHTNVDQVAAVLENRARPQDLIVISPWFLHPGFQRYYRGNVPWITVPVMDHYPMMRYDLIKKAITQPVLGDDLVRGLEGAVGRGGDLWFVSQRVWVNLDRREAPEEPLLTTVLDGGDYVRFRSYWERGIEYRLNSCCRRNDVALPAVGRVWDEEDLSLTRWSAR